MGQGRALSVRRPSLVLWTHEFQDAKALQLMFVMGDSFLRGGFTSSLSLLYAASSYALRQCSIVAYVVDLFEFHNSSNFTFIRGEIVFIGQYVYHRDHH